MIVVPLVVFIVAIIVSILAGIYFYVNSKKKPKTSKIGNSKTIPYMESIHNHYLFTSPNDRPIGRHIYKLDMDIIDSHASTRCFRVSPGKCISAPGLPTRYSISLHNSEMIPLVDSKLMDNSKEIYIGKSYNVIEQVVKDSIIEIRSHDESEESPEWDHIIIPAINASDTISITIETVNALIEPSVQTYDAINMEPHATMTEPVKTSSLEEEDINKEDLTRVIDEHSYENDVEFKNPVIVSALRHRDIYGTLSAGGELETLSSSDTYPMIPDNFMRDNTIFVSDKITSGTIIGIYFVDHKKTGKADISYVSMVNNSGRELICESANMSNMVNDADKVVDNLHYIELIAPCDGYILENLWGEKITGTGPSPIKTRNMLIYELTGSSALATTIDISSKQVTFDC